MTSECKCGYKVFEALDNIDFLFRHMPDLPKDAYEKAINETKSILDDIKVVCLKGREEEFYSEVLINDAKSYLSESKTYFDEGNYTEARIRLILASENLGNALEGCD